MTTGATLYAFFFEKSSKNYSKITIEIIPLLFLSLQEFCLTYHPPLKHGLGKRSKVVFVCSIDCRAFQFPNEFFFKKILFCEKQVRVSLLAESSVNKVYLHQGGRFYPSSVHAYERTYLDLRLGDIAEGQKLEAGDVDYLQKNNY